MNAPVLAVLECVGMATAVDLGRRSHARYGVAPSGPFDRVAHEQANRLVGNDLTRPPGAATLEVVAGPLTLKPSRAVLMAVTGPVQLWVGPVRIDPARPFAVPAGVSVTVRTDAGLRGWLAVRGGFDLPAVLGSRSWDSLARLGPPPLVAGQRITVGPPPRTPLPAPVARARPESFEQTIAGFNLPVLAPPGGEVPPELLTQWTVTGSADRVAVRLSGPSLTSSTADAPSRPLVRGAVQLPGDGQPLVFGPDHPLTGGYPVLGVVTELGLARLAQAAPGTLVRFVPAVPALG